MLYTSICYLDGYMTCWEKLPQTEGAHLRCTFISHVQSPVLPERFTMCWASTALKGEPKVLSVVNGRLCLLQT